MKVWMPICYTSTWIGVWDRGGGGGALCPSPIKICQCRKNYWAKFRQFGGAWARKVQESPPTPPAPPWARYCVLIQWTGPIHLWLFSHDGKVRILNFNSRCAFWIKIQNTQKRQCVCQITSQNVIWNAHLKSRYRGVFQLRFSQITQQNLCMNDLTSESCFWGRS